MPLLPASKIVARPIDWLWPGHLPLGYLALLDGDPGLGKSFLTLDLCARLSTGRPFPDDAPTSGPANCIVLNAEDGPADVLRPRLAALGADLDRVFLWPRDAGEPWPRLPAHLGRLDHALAETDARLVVLDPLLSFLDSSVIAASDQHVRNALGPLADLAARRRCAILMVRHLNKRTGQSALYRGSHSIALTALCRATWLVARDPDAPARLLLAQVKNNIDLPQPTLCFSIQELGESGQRSAISDQPEAGYSSLLSHGHSSLATRHSSLVWHGPSPRTADELLDAPDLALIRARNFLTAILQPGPQLGRTIRAAATKQNISRRTLAKAKNDLQIQTHRRNAFAHDQTVYWLLRGQSMPAQPPEIDFEKWFGPLRTHGDEMAEHNSEQKQPSIELLMQ